MVLNCNTNFNGMKASRIILLIIILTSVFAPIYSQQSDTYTIDKADWKDYKTLNGVEISYKIVEYHDRHYDQHKEFYVLRVTNTTAVTMHIHAKKVLWYNGKCFNCNSDSKEYIYDFNIKPGDELVGVPMGKKGNKLALFKKFLNKPDVPEVTKFEFDNLTINPVEE